MKSTDSELIIQRCKEKLSALHDDNTQLASELKSKLLRVIDLAKNDFKVSAITHKTIFSVLEKVQGKQFTRKEKKIDGRSLKRGIKVPAHDKHSKYRHEKREANKCPRCGKDSGITTVLCEPCSIKKNSYYHRKKNNDFFHSYLVLEKLGFTYDRDSWHEDGNLLEFHNWNKEINPHVSVLIHCQYENTVPVFQFAKLSICPDEATFEYETEIELNTTSMKDIETLIKLLTPSP